MLKNSFCCVNLPLVTRKLQQPSNGTNDIGTICKAIAAEEGSVFFNVFIPAKPAGDVSFYVGRAQFTVLSQFEGKFGQNRKHMLHAGNRGRCRNNISFLPVNLHRRIFRMHTDQRRDLEFLSAQLCNHAAGQTIPAGIKRGPGYNDIGFVLLQGRQDGRVRFLRLLNEVVVTGDDRDRQAARDTETGRPGRTDRPRTA